MREYPTDYRLWSLASGVIVTGICAAVLIFSPSLPNKFLLEFAKGTDRAITATGELVVVGFIYFGIAAVAGWVIQGAAVICGVRLGRRPTPLDAADYEDKPPTG